MMTRFSLKSAGLQLSIPRPFHAAEWLCENMDFHIDQRQPDRVSIHHGNCRIILVKNENPAICQIADEGYFTGLAHIAFATGDMNIMQISRLPQCCSRLKTSMD